MTRPLPRKKWFNSLSADVVRQRMTDLEGYLRALVARVPPGEFPNLGTFLELNRKRAASGALGGSLGRRTAPLALVDGATLPAMRCLADAAKSWPEAYGGAAL